MSIHHPAPESRFAKSSHATVSTLKFIWTYQRTIPPRPGVAHFWSRKLNSPLQRSAKSSVQGVTPPFEAMVLREGEMLDKVSKRRRRLLMTFPGHRRRCREYVGLKDTRESRMATAGIVREIELAITSGKFDYQGCFPAHRNLERLGLQPVAKLENPTSPKLWGDSQPSGWSNGAHDSTPRPTDRHDSRRIFLLALRLR
jgi:Arm DNA-binding domain